MKPFKPQQVMSHDLQPGPEQPHSGRYSLLAVSTPAGRNFYFMSAYRRFQRCELLEVSPVLATDHARALHVFHRLARAGEVSPIHLVDVVQDLRGSGAVVPIMRDAAAGALP